MGGYDKLALSAPIRRFYKIEMILKEAKEPTEPTDSFLCDYDARIERERPEDTPRAAASHKLARQRHPRFSNASRIKSHFASQSVGL